MGVFDLSSLTFILHASSLIPHPSILHLQARRLRYPCKAVNLTLRCKFWIRVAKRLKLVALFA